MIRIVARPSRARFRILSRLAIAALTISAFASATAIPGLMPTMAGAADRPVALDQPRLAQAPEPLCFCWSDGRKIAEGASACIRTNQGRRLAACGRVINMMSWEVSENPCPES